jgi:hypothetical protein
VRDIIVTYSAPDILANHNKAVDTTAHPIVKINLRPPSLGIISSIAFSPALRRFVLGLFKLKL